MCKRCPLSRMVILALLIVFSVASQRAYGGPENDLERIRALFKEGHVLHAHMTHLLTDSYTGETNEIAGEMWISRDKYKIKAEFQTVLVDGSISRVYNDRQNKLIISAYVPEEDDFAPSRFFSDKEKLFHVADAVREGAVTVLTLYPEDPYEIFTEVTIRLLSDLTPDLIRAKDQMDNIFVTRFTEARFLKYSDDYFGMEYPEDAEIIDLRK